MRRRGKERGARLIRLFLSHGIPCANPESIKSRLFGEIPRLGGSREDKDAREEKEVEEAILKSEKLNYIAVKNDARGFSVS